MGSIRRVVAQFSDLDDRTRVVPAWVAPIFLAMSLLLVPWTVLLFVTLPENYTAARWRLAWGGFDVGLAVSLGATAILALRRSALMQTAAAISAAFLVCDAWFDVLTSRGRDVWFAIVLALLVELPLAALCIWIARSVERVLADARPYLEAGGFTIRHRRLVAPPAAEALRGDADAKSAPTSK